MARKIKENKNMALSDLPEEDNNERERDENNQGDERRRVNSRMRSKQTKQRLAQLKAEKKMLEKEIEFLVNEIIFIKQVVNQAGTSQINVPKSVLKTLLSDTTSDILLENDLKKPQSSP